MSQKIKVLVVDDSLLFRESLAKLLNNDNGIEVVGTASDVFEARDKILSLRPDVMTLDIEMPKMNGIDFLRRLIPQYPIPVVVVSSLPVSAFEAITAGAVDYIKKPMIKGPSDMENFAAYLCSMVKMASTAKITSGVTVSEPVSFSGKTVSRERIIALGASTGGTDALQTVLECLPANSPGIVVVQHMPSGFTKMYAERMNHICKMEVKEAENGDRVRQGLIIIAQGGLQMRLKKDNQGYYVTCTPDEKVSGHRPSVDALFESVAEVAGNNAVAAILTGMGSDGAAGLMKLRKAGAFTIGQDKETCVVYGMPMVAYNIGAVIKQAPLQNIAGLLIEHF